MGSEYEKNNARSKEVGQIMKLDPTKPDDPLVWSIPDQVAGKAGIWATPALGDGVVYSATNGGRVLGVDMATGEILWSKNLGSQTWQSPVVVDDMLIEGDCEGNLHAYDVTDPTDRPAAELWTVKLDGCIETTPAVWKGRIYVGHPRRPVLRHRRPGDPGGHRDHRRPRVRPRRPPSGSVRHAPGDVLSQR